MTTIEPTTVEYDDEERPGRRPSGRTEILVSVVCALVSCFVLYAVFRPLPQGPQYYLTLFLMIVLPLGFLCYRPRPGRRTTAPEATEPGVPAGREPLAHRGFSHRLRENTGRPAGRGCRGVS